MRALYCSNGDPGLILLCKDTVTIEQVQRVFRATETAYYKLDGFVGEVDPWRKLFVQQAKRLRIGLIAMFDEDKADFINPDKLEYVYLVDDGYFDWEKRPKRAEGRKE